MSRVRDSWRNHELSTLEGLLRKSREDSLGTILETAAAETGRDAIALRRLNHVRPEEMPYKAVSGQTYDSGNFTAVLNRALQLADWDGFASRRADSLARSRTCDWAPSAPTTSLAARVRPSAVRTVATEALTDRSARLPMMRRPPTSSNVATQAAASAPLSAI